MSSQLHELPEGMTAIGFTTSDTLPDVPNDTIAIPEGKRLHALVGGNTGSGKSTVLKMMARQNLIRGDGLAVFDPHGDFAEYLAKRVPRWRANKLVYISPKQLKRTGRVIPVDPLEPATDNEAPITPASDFADTLMFAFGYGLDSAPRMINLIKMAAEAVIASGRGGLNTIKTIMNDKAERNDILANVHIKDNLDYWNHTFETIQKDALPPVMNKLAPIVGDPSIGPFFDAGRTGFDSYRLIDEDGILLFDGSDLTDTVRTLFTTFLLTKLFTTAKRRPTVPPPKPFYVYVDEFQMLETSRLKEMLQQIRKWGVKLTLATQQLESINPEDMASMRGNCGLYIMSSCTTATANMIKGRMGIEDAGELVRTPKYHFNYHMSKDDGDIHGKLVRTRPIDGRDASWKLEDIVDRSLENYGVKVDLTKYMNKPAAEYDVKPLEFGLLCSLYYSKGGLSASDLQVTANAYDGVDNRRTLQILDHLKVRGMLNEFQSGESTRYELSGKAIDSHFNQAAVKGRAGGDPHIATIKALRDHFARRGIYARMDTGDTSKQKPDLELACPAFGPNGELSPSEWGDQVSIEVEYGPGRHPNKPGAPGQVYKNLKKVSIPVWFLVFRESDADVIRRQLGELGVGEDGYHLDVIDYDAILAGTKVPSPPPFRKTPGVLPGCGDRPRLDQVLLNGITPDAVPLREVRNNMAKICDDRQFAEALDRLREAQLIRVSGKGKNEEVRLA